MCQSNPRTPIPPGHTPGIWREPLAPYGGEFDVKRSPPGRAFHYRENVGQRQQAEGLRGKGYSNTTKKKATTNK